MKEQKPLTKAETAALWNAVQNSALMLKEGRELMTEEQFLQEQARIATAKRALRKVYELRKQGL